MQCAVSYIRDGPIYKEYLFLLQYFLEAMSAGKLFKSEYHESLWMENPTAWHERVPLSGIFSPMTGMEYTDGKQLVSKLYLAPLIGSKIIQSKMIF